MRTGHLRALFADAAYRRLLVVRLVAQFGDGVFQASLAGAVLFNPERQSNAADIAAGFAVLLLPYSLIGPFAGVWLDRWSRRGILAWGGPVRAVATLITAVAVYAGFHGVPLYALALVALSLARFVLAALSAAQPHVVTERLLPTANAFGTTAGTVATTAGGLAALGLRQVLGADDHGYGVIGMCAIAIYLLAGHLARSFGRDALGPDDRERGARESVLDVARGLVAGARHVRSRPAAFDALTAIGSVRLCHGITTVCTVLLYRNYFHSHGLFAAGLGGLGQVVAATAVGGALAALITPTMVRGIGLDRWPVVLIASSAAVQLTLILPFRVELVPFAFLLTSVSSQGVKICVDTIVQRDVDDEFRGRVFSYYDALFNVALVAAAVLVSLVLPADGRAPTAVYAVAGVYLTTSLWYAATTGRRERVIA